MICDQDMFIKQMHIQEDATSVWSVKDDLSSHF